MRSEKEIRKELEIHAPCGIIDIDDGDDGYLDGYIQALEWVLEGDGWHDARKEFPADGEQVIWAILLKGSYEQGLESPDGYEYIYGRYYEEMEVIRLPWSDKEYKVKWMNYWRRIDPPVFK